MPKAIENICQHSFLINKEELSEQVIAHKCVCRLAVKKWSFRFKFLFFKVKTDPLCTGNTISLGKNGLGRSVSCIDSLYKKQQYPAHL